MRRTDLAPQPVAPGSAVVLGVVVVVEVLLTYFKTPADIFNRTISGFLYAYLVCLGGEAIVRHARVAKIWGAWYEVAVALAIFVLYHLIYGGILLLPFAASVYFGMLAWGGLARERVPLGKIGSAAAALFLSGMFVLPLPALFVRGLPMVVVSLVLSALLWRSGMDRLGRLLSSRELFGVGALAFFAGVWLSSGILLVRTITGYLD